MPATRQNVIDRLYAIENLPTLPVVMTKLSRALDDPNCSAVDIEKILINDPSISAQILKTVNSPLFSTGGAKIVDLKMAVARLGFKEVRNVALSTSVFKMFDNMPSRLFDRQEFWKHCLSTSLACIELGRILKNPRRYKADELHLAGLVHDIGKIVLDAEFGDLFEQSISLSMQMNLPLFQAEHVVMEIDHAELGQLIAERWNLPEVAAAAIRYHHRVEEAPPEQADVVNVVNMANYIVNTQELGTGGDFTAPAFSKHVWENLGLKAEDIQAVVRAVGDKSADLMQIF